MPKKKCKCGNEIGYYDKLTACSSCLREQDRCTSCGVHLFSGPKLSGNYAILRGSRCINCRSLGNELLARFK